VAGIAVISMLDWVFLAILLMSFLIGAWRGLVYELLSLASWAAAFVLAQWFAPDVAQKLPMAGAGESVRYAAGFGLTFVVAVFAGGLIAALIKKLISAVGLAPMDRVLGAVFGLVRGLVVLLAITVVVAMTPLKTSVWWTESMGAGALGAVLKGLKPVLPQEFAKYLG
jgi:membrane protein required for colicin V production